MSIQTKYRGYAVRDMASYLECRKRIAEGFLVKHHLGLKAHYRRTFLNNPFRKAK